MLRSSATESDGFVGDAHQLVARERIVADLEEIARAFGHDDHAGDEDHRRNDGAAEHPAPLPAVRERVVDDVGRRECRP